MMPTTHANMLAAPQSEYSIRTYVRTAVCVCVCVAREGAGTGEDDHYTTHFNLYLPSDATQAKGKAYRVLASSAFSEPLVWVK